MMGTGLREFIGCDYTSEPLKPIGLRARNALKPWLIRQPQRAMSQVVTSSDGRRFKLLTFGASIDDKRRSALQRLTELAELDCVPALLWSDERHVLVEWVEGESPRATDPIFARRLGEAFAALYRIGLAWPTRSDVVGRLLEQTRPLFGSGRLPQSAEARLEETLTQELPETVPTATLCGDQTLANFVLGADGRLSMIDPGSFQTGLPIDIFFAGGYLYDQIDREAFHDAYDAAGGIDFPFAHREPLQLFQLARASALQTRVLDSTPAFEIRRKRNLRRNIESRLARLRELLTG